MDLSKYIIKRLGLSIFVLIGLSMVIFIISRVVPGDPARLALGPRAPQFAVDALRSEMHLDETLPVQYYYWGKGVLTGDLGNSLITKRSVLEDIKEFFPATFELAIFSSIMTVFFAIFFGSCSAKYKDKWVDNLIRVLSYAGVAIPSFVLAVLLLLLFGYILPIMPVLGRISAGINPPPVITGMITVDALITGNLHAFWDALKHIIVPATALAASSTFQEARITRSAIIDNMGKDYIALATAYGIPKNVIFSRHLLKPSLIPAVSVMGLDIASLMANAFIVERIYNWPGLSKYGMDAMLRKDLNAISSVIVIYGLVFIIINIIVDVIVAYLDPRIRMGGQN